MLNVDNLGGQYKSELYTITDNNAVIRFINNIMSDMDHVLSSRQLLELNKVLQNTIKNYSISTDEELYADKDWRELNSELLESFLDGKKLQGLSPQSLNAYEFALKFAFNYMGKSADSITPDDVRDYLQYMIEERKTSLTTVDNYRRTLNTFYNYCVTNGLLYKNPILKINAIKKVKKIKQPFTNEEIIELRNNIFSFRDKAIFELLLSSGMRVGELVQLNRNDLDMNNCTVIVHGKGDKERECFFNDLAKVSIQEYLDTRVDYNPALFVAKQKPYNRVSTGTVEQTLNKLGKRSGVNKVHPHRFRRHFATTLLNKGVHIEQIQQLLGHAEIATTQLYVTTNEDEIQYNHKRYVN